MSDLQHSDYVFFIKKDGEKAYLKFSYSVLKNKDIDYDSKVPYTYKTADYNTVLSANILYVDKIEEATIMNNSESSTLYEKTAEIHGVFACQLGAIMGDLKIMSV